MPADYRVPVIDRMVDVVRHLEGAGTGATIPEISAICRIPRSTVYRILNTLEAHGLVHRNQADGGYQLGTGFLRIAAHVPRAQDWQHVQTASRPAMRWLSAETGEPVKLSVFDGDAALCIDVIPGSGQYSLAPHVGGRYPMHAGAASKVLLASLDPAAREVIVAGALEQYTSRTITNPRKLASELDRILHDGWGRDIGEFKLSVHAIAVPIRDAAAGRVVAALSIPYLADQDEADIGPMLDKLREAAAKVDRELATRDRAAPIEAADGREAPIMASRRSRPRRVTV
jgi:DNA-binding IclR family transcriptional regulator